MHFLFFFIYGRSDEGILFVGNGDVEVFTKKWERTDRAATEMEEGQAGV